MKVSVETKGAARIVRLTGRLDSTTASIAEAAILDSMRLGDLVVDLDGVAYVSSAGLRVFLKAAKTAKALNHRLVLAALGDQVQEVFEISGFTALFAIAPSVESAVA